VNLPGETPVPSVVKVALLALLSCLALLAAGCGGYGESSSSSSSAPVTESGKGTEPAQESSAKTDPTAAMQEFLDAVESRDAEGFCRLTEAGVQRENFEAAGVPAGGDCVASAEAMFAAKAPDGSEPFWEAIAGATIGTAELDCASAGHCESAVVEVRDLPLAGGGTTSAPINLTYSHGQWRIGPL
jgi:hypothetical protein